MKMVIISTIDGTMFKFYRRGDGYATDTKPKGKWIYRNLFWHIDAEKAWTNMEILIERCGGRKT